MDAPICPLSLKSFWSWTWGIVGYLTASLFTSMLSFTHSLMTQRKKNMNLSECILKLLRCSGGCWEVKYSGWVWMFLDCSWSLFREITLNAGQPIWAWPVVCNMDKSAWPLIASLYKAAINAKLFLLST